MYTQSIHLGDSHSFEEFINGFDESAFDWESILESYSEWFGKDRIIARRYHKAFLRSEEHTSELQSRGHLVCRLRLEDEAIGSAYVSDVISSKLSMPGHHA